MDPDVASLLPRSCASLQRHKDNFDDVDGDTDFDKDFDDSDNDNLDGDTDFDVDFDD